MLAVFHVSFRMVYSSTRDVTLYGVSSGKANFGFVPNAVLMSVYDVQEGLFGNAISALSPFGFSPPFLNALLLNRSQRSLKNQPSGSQLISSGLTVGSFWFKQTYFTRPCRADAQQAGVWRITLAHARVKIQVKASQYTDHIALQSTFQLTIHQDTVTVFTFEYELCFWSCKLSDVQMVLR